MILIPLMAFLSRACGASWKPRGAEWMFALPFAYCSYALFGWWGLLGLFTTYIGMQLGHGNFWKMRGAEGGEVKKVELVVRLFYKKTDTALYSWLCFGLKGLIIGLCVFPYGLALAVLWPLAYHLSWKYFNGTMPAEWISGGFAGAILWWSL